MAYRLSLWNLVAELCFLAGFIWHFTIRKEYLRTPEEYQHRPQIISLLFLLGIIAQSAFSVRGLQQSLDRPPDQATPAYSNLYYEVDRGTVDDVTIHNQEIYGQYKSRERFRSTLPADHASFDKFMLDRGVSIHIKNDLVYSLFTESVEYLEFMLVLRGAAFVLSIVMFILFSQFKTIHHARELETETKNVADSDPLGIADDLRRLKDSR
jgi:hypothetical protein